jgi:hypothetical protein
MLYYRWNLSPVNTPELQRAILASGLVNWQGKSASHKAIDLGMEHLNANCKIEMKSYKNSTHDIDVSFDRVCLTNTWVRFLRSKLEGVFGRPISGSHTSASTALEVFSLARSLFTSDLSRPRSAEQLAGFSSFYDSPDILDEGVKRLEEKIKRFNKEFVYQPNKHEKDTTGGDINIDEYAEVIDDQFDGVLDYNLNTIDDDLE